MKRALLVKMSSLGDVVHALPAVNDACAAGWQIDWVVEEGFAEIPRMHPGVDRVLPVALRRWRRNLREARSEMAAFREDLRARTYDVVLDSQGLWKSAAVALFARGPRAGYNFTSAREPWAAFAYGRRALIPRGHAIDRQRQLFSQLLDYDYDPAVLHAGLPTAAEPSNDVFLLHGTTWDSKHWPDEMWCDLVRCIRADGYGVTVTWGDAREQARARLLEEAGAQVLPRDTLTSLATRLGAAAVVVGVDSGLLHLSAVMGVPTLGLYGSTDPWLTGCRGPAASVLQSTVPCAPCVRPTCTRYVGDPVVWQGQEVTPPCFGELTPDRVWQQARQRMRPAVL